ncbi:MAG TPA: hypothetical protein VMD30_12975 [Tepidisphaeraceae bacterium]|nr:hypothetical protein [Tepidisphaeraceae bacterium]
MKGNGVCIGIAAVVATVAGVAWSAGSPDIQSTPAAPASVLQADDPTSLLSAQPPRVIELLPPPQSNPTATPASPPQSQSLASTYRPLMLDDDQSDLVESPYTESPPPLPGEGLNQGGVNNDLSLTYFNHYMYRGVDHSITSTNGTKGTTLNLEINDQLEFNLGDLPHPFLGVFANVYDADPKSRFQEIRPFYGFDWDLKPLDIIAGGNSYLYPRREGRDTAEGFGQLTLDDSFLVNSDKPFLSPYMYAAYDYHRNNGWYLEAGISHQVPLEDIGVTLDFQADMAYIIDFPQQFVYYNLDHDTGFQHYDVGTTATYSLTRFFDIPASYGEFNLKGYLFYTGKLNSELTANNVLWGGVGIEFKY